MLLAFETSMRLMSPETLHIAEEEQNLSIALKPKLLPLVNSRPSTEVLGII